MYYVLFYDDENYLTAVNREFSTGEAARVYADTITKSRRAFTVYRL